MSPSPVLELLLADGRTPSGGYAHSGGLEAAIAEGLGVADVPAFVRARLHTVGRCQAALAAAAAAAPDLCTLLGLDGEAAARTPVPALRAADRRLGRALLRTAGAIWPEQGLVSAYREVSALTPRAVALGVVCAAAGLRPLAVARLSLYEEAAGVAAAAVKLLPVDGARASGWVASLAQEIETLAGEAAGQWGTPDGGAPPVPRAREIPTAGGGQVAGGRQAGSEPIPSTATPLLDRRALAHDARPGRLFAS